MSTNAPALAYRCCWAYKQSKGSRDRLETSLAGIRSEEQMLAGSQRVMALEHRKERIMPDKNYILYVAVYPESSAAAADFRSLKGAQDKDFKLDKAVVVSRTMDGKVEVDQSGTGEVGRGAMIGGGAGLALGLFAPPLLLATAVGAGIGAVGGELRKKYEERRLGLQLDETVPPGSSAIVALIDDKYLDRVERTLTRSTKQVQKEVEPEDYDKLDRALSESSKGVESTTEP